MNYTTLQKLKSRFYFNNEDLQNILELTPESARVISSRHTKDGFFIRLKRDFYVLSENWGRFCFEDFLKTANLILVPSYISFLTALSFYKLTNFAQQDVFESASLRRSLQTIVNHRVTFSYCKINSLYYFDFVKLGDIFIATPEKAFIDSIYLYSYGKYPLDFTAINIEKLDKNKITALLKVFPKKTKDIARKICGI